MLWNGKVSKYDIQGICSSVNHPQISNVDEMFKSFIVYTYSSKLNKI